MKYVQTIDSYNFLFIYVWFQGKLILIICCLIYFEFIGVSYLCFDYSLV